MEHLSLVVAKQWTTDEILLDYRFCNPVRINDKVSKWLLDNWYAPYRGHANMVVACTLARQVNNPEALEEVGFPTVWDPKQVQETLERRQRRGLKTYSAAYMITSRFGRNRLPETKPYQTVWRVCNPVYESKLKANTSSMELTWSSLLPFQGFSSFIAGQVVADLRWALEGTWADKDTWAPMGPGSMRGMNRLLGRPIAYKISQEHFVSELRVLKKTLEKAAGLPRLEMMDLQNCLCEYDKYCRVLNGEGRPKTYYQGRA